MVDEPLVDGGESMAERVAGTLRDEIAGGAFRPDTFLPPEHALIERFGVSRPTCREALRILQSEGLVSPIRGNRGGARVNFPDPRRISAYAGVLLQMRGATIIEVFDARRLVEPEAVARLAAICDTAILSALAQNATAQRFLVGDQVAFYRKGRDFRQLMIENCGSEPIRLFGLMLGHIADRQLSMLAEKQPPWDGRVDSNRRAVRMKEDLVAALERQDAAAARSMWDGYLTFYVDELKTVTAGSLRDASPFPLGC